MRACDTSLRERYRDLIPAGAGFGPLLQRDYWAIIRDCRLSCEEVAAQVRSWFAVFPPEAYVRFSGAKPPGAPLEVGDRLEVKIGLAGRTAVRVVHLDRNSITVCTVAGHPEAGRITFGAYRNRRGDVVFHIRSRARSSSRLRRLAFRVIGDPMQTNTWTDFIDRLAHTVGTGVIGAIHAETRVVHDVQDDVALFAPTFVARGA